MYFPGCYLISLASVRPVEGAAAIESLALIIVRNASLNSSSGACLSCVSLLISNRTDGALLTARQSSSSLKTGQRKGTF